MLIKRVSSVRAVGGAQRGKGRIVALTSTVHMRGGVDS